MKFKKVRAAILIFFLLFAAPLFAQEKTDVVVMKNGDRITCEIKVLERGALQLNMDYVDGTISVDWSKVERVESDRLFIVKTEKGVVFTGKISTAAGTGDGPVKIEVAETSAKKVELESKEVIKIGSTSEKFFHRFNGEINVGMTYAKGNQSTQYSLNSSVEYPRDRWSARMRLNSTLSSNTSSETVTRNQLSFDAQRLMRWRKWFYAGTAGFLQSSEQGIKLRSTLGVGVGRFLKNTDQARISLTGGIVWQRTKYSRAGNLAPKQNATAGLISADVRLFRFKKTNLSIDAEFLPSITEPGRVYFSLNESFYVKLYSNLTWNISFYGNWDSRPPVGLLGSDYGTSTGLGWTFGNK